MFLDIGFGERVLVSDEGKRISLFIHVLNTKLHSLILLFLFLLCRHQVFFRLSDLFPFFNQIFFQDAQFDEGKRV